MRSARRGLSTRGRDGRVCGERLAAHGAAEHLDVLRRERVPTEVVVDVTLALLCPFGIPAAVRVRLDQTRERPLLRKVAEQPVLAERVTGDAVVVGETGQPVRHRLYERARQPLRERR